MRQVNDLAVRNRPHDLVQLVRDRILSGTVSSDLSIRQDVLAAELGVSKIPLREALAKLEQEGLLRLHVNRGFFVAPLSAQEAEEVYALRLRLEPEAVAEAAARAGIEEQQLARAALQSLGMSTREHGEGVGPLNRAFHLALIRPAGQPVTTSILERLHVLSERYVRKHLEPLGRDERADEEHGELLDRWLARDADAVAGLMRAHILKTLQDLRVQLPAIDGAERFTATP